MNNTFKKKFEYLSEDPATALAVLDFFLGKHIGSGISRDVYEFNIDDKWVVKIEHGGARGDNWAEYRVWGAVMYTEHAKWFAECSWISDDGRVMLQRKTKPVETKSNKYIPDKIPIYFSDVKEENFGFIGNQLVCHDYSFCIEMFSSYGLSKRMKKTPFKY